MFAQLSKKKMDHYHRDKFFLSLFVVGPRPSDILIHAICLLLLRWQQQLIRGASSDRVESRLRKQQKKNKTRAALWRALRNVFIVMWTLSDVLRDFFMINVVGFFLATIRAGRIRKKRLLD